MSNDSPREPDFDSFEWDSEEHNDIFDVAAPLEKTVRQDASPADSVAESLAPLDAIPTPDSTPNPLKSDGEPLSAHEEAPRSMHSPPPVPRRSSTRWKLDPLFAYLVLMGLSFGLTPLALGQPMGRYSVLWTLLAGTVLMLRLLDDGRLEVQLKANHLLWGAGWGLVVGLPLLLVGPGLLSDVSHRIFVGMPDGAVFQTIVFVMVTTESAFFRGIIQKTRSVMLTAAMASAWSVLLFFPTMDIGGFPSIALIAGTFIVLLNILYSYVCQRSGPAAAWVTQTLVSLAWLFLPRLQI